MDSEIHRKIDKAMDELNDVKRMILCELRDYPTPISPCDVQYSHLVGEHTKVLDALATLRDPRFVASPRCLEPTSRVESR